MKRVLTVLMLTIASISMAQEKVLLRLNYEKGDRYEVQMKMKQDMGAALMDMSMKMGLDVTNIVDDNYETTTKFTYISTVILEGGVEKISYNSNMKEEELTEEAKKMKTQMEPMMKAVIFSEVTKLGENKIIKVEPIMPGVSEFANQSNKSVVYPTEAVGVGSTWVNTQSNQGISMKMTYKVTEITKNKVFANLVGEMSLMPTAKIAGKIEIDRKTGVPTSTLINIEMDMMGKVIKNTTEATISKI